MVEMKNSCDGCVHKPICKYADQFQKSMEDIVRIAKDQFEVYDLNGLIDLTIRCRQYVMAPYRENKVDHRRMPIDFCYDPIREADAEARL